MGRKTKNDSGDVRNRGRPERRDMLLWREEATVNGNGERHPTGK